jgi:hypothetical protein
MMTPEKAKAGWRAGCSQSAGTWASGSEGEHSPTLRRWRTVARMGVALAGWALDRYARATDEPAWTVIDAADHIDAAAQYLAPLSELLKPLKRNALGGDA